MISALYASLIALWIAHLAFKVIGLRRQHLVSLGDGGHNDLQAAIAAHANTIEYTPILLLLMFALEYNGGNIFILHFTGIMMLIGRVIHAKALSDNNIDNRVVGMKFTFNTLFILVGANLFYLPYPRLLGF